MLHGVTAALILVVIGTIAFVFINRSSKCILLVVVFRFYTLLYINIRTLHSLQIALDVGVIGVLVFIAMMGMLNKVDDSRK
ncbi:hypothetical protein [Paenibacillus sp. FSL H8-0260]|uniref:hypothetical protein n=1 Tax=Paenibacillus sp. FSL H8-0260 TaxID=2921380 RepID=UPI0032468F35